MSRNEQVPISDNILSLQLRYGSVLWVASVVYWFTELALDLNVVGQNGFSSGLQAKAGQHPPV